MCGYGLMQWVDAWTGSDNVEYGCPVGNVDEGQVGKHYQVDEDKLMVGTGLRSVILCLATDIRWMQCGRVWMDRRQKRMMDVDIGKKKRDGK